MKHQIRTEIVINASKERVYQILTNLEGYEKWNPFIVKSKGKVAKGARLVNTMVNGDSTITFKPKVMKAEDNKTFEWLGSLFVKGLFDGHHYFRIEEIAPEQINLVHGETFSGILASFLLKKIGQQTRENFVAMNQALKALAEEK
jgi:hypothetical protein